jgi:hypothetical protein
MGRRLSTKLYEARKGQVGFYCPACKHIHYVYVDGYEHGGARWEFNGDVDSPTFQPSLSIQTNYPRTQEEYDKPITYVQCHLFIVNGNIQYLSDSPHAYSGQTIPIPDYFTDEIKEK